MAPSHRPLASTSLTLAALSTLILSTSAAAQPSGAPPSLERWVPWVEASMTPKRCAQIGHGGLDRRCAWPASLRLQVEEAGGRFEMNVWLDAEAEVTLPGSAAEWPLDVTADGREATLRDRAGTPVVRLPAGLHQLGGRFAWSAPPAQLRVPSDVARVSLAVNGASLQPRLTDGGELWLRPVEATPDAPGEADRLQLEVMRLVQDGVPVKVTTRLELTVSGEARQITVPGLLLEGARPTAVHGNLPMDLRPDGEARIFVRPGTWSVEVQSVLVRPVGRLARPESRAEEAEVWVWQPAPQVRAVKTGGPPTLPMERTALPQPWRNGTAFQVDARPLTLETIQAGEAQPPPNQLDLRRSLWLDLDGRGWTAWDHLSGQMHRTWRLDYGQGGHPVRVTDLLHQRDLLITANPSTQRPGVELRQSTVDLQAEVRHPSAEGTLSAVGWDHDVQSLATTVHVPPGWDLVGASGADHVEGTWWSSWTLFDVLFVILISLAIGALQGWPWGAVAALALIIGQGHPEAPRWVLVHLVVTLALLRALPAGWWRGAVVLYRAGALVALAVIVAPHADDLLLTAFHPQVAADQRQDRAALPVWGGDGDALNEVSQTLALSDEEGEATPTTSATPDPEPEPEPWTGAGANLRAASARSSGVSTQIPAVEAGSLRELDPNAVVQTGRGLPEWRWKQWELRWDGPVAADHTVELWLLSPGLGRALAVFRVLLLVLLTLALIAPRDTRFSPPDPSTTPRRRGWRAIWPLAAGALVLLAPSLASAQEDSYPPQWLLSQLRDRVAADGTCGGPCVVASRGTLEARGDRLLGRVEVHAARDAAWLLPSRGGAFWVDAVRVDGQPTSRLRREGDHVAVRLDAGVRQVEFEGALPTGDAAVDLTFEQGMRPRHLEVEGQGWRAEGLEDAGAAGQPVRLVRLGGEANPPPPGAAAPRAAFDLDLPPWLDATRRFTLGLPWRVETTVRRADAREPLTLTFPLVEGEVVTGGSAEATEAGARLTFPVGVAAVQFSSRLPLSDRLTLTAPEDRPWTETWRVACASVWRCDFSGTTPLRSVDGDVYAPLFEPWPGERVVVAVSRPSGVPGPSVTFDRVDYTLRPDDRQLLASLHIVARASAAGWHTLLLPQEAEVQSVQIDGAEARVRLEGGQLELPLEAGRQEIDVRWQQSAPPGPFERYPTVDLQSPAANAQVRLLLDRGQPRWLLWTTGPPWGPAIVFWTRVGTLLGLALLLALTMPGLPIRRWEWPLLVLGLTQVSYLALIPIAGWFAALAWRRRGRPRSTWGFGALQVGLVLLSALALYALQEAVVANLVSPLDVEVLGGGSSAESLGWYVDHLEGEVPAVGVLSVPRSAWRALMLLWALWLAARLLTWGPWAWRAFSEGGRFPSRGDVPDPDADDAPEDDGDGSGPDEPQGHDVEGGDVDT